MSGRPPLRTALVGFGQIAAGLSKDSLMAKYFRYATHAQVLADHPRFKWEAVVDVSPSALDAAKEHWGVPVAVDSVAELARRCEPDVVVLATPPEHRLEIIDNLPSLKAVLVEKPLGRNLDESKRFLDTCAERGLKVQVNFWRRGDEYFQRLAAGELARLVGRRLAVFGLYGNGLRNNGSHLIDFVRMLLGEIAEARVIDPRTAFTQGPTQGDLNTSCMLILESGLQVVLQPVPFSAYREVSLDIWGETGRLALYQESLGIYHYPRRPNRGLENEWEIASDQPTATPPTCGEALYRMYDNLAGSVLDGETLWSPAEGALRVEKILHGLLSEVAENTRGPQ